MTLSSKGSTSNDNGEQGPGFQIYFLLMTSFYSLSLPLKTGLVGKCAYLKNANHPHNPPVSTSICLEKTNCGGSKKFAEVVRQDLC